MAFDLPENTWDVELYCVFITKLHGSSSLSYIRNAIRKETDVANTPQYTPDLQQGYRMSGIFRAALDRLHDSWLRILLCVFPQQYRTTSKYDNLLSVCL